jgi:CheY-like chemotaxis protein
VDKAEPPTPEEAPRGTERILFVDDEAPVAELGKDLLESYGYTVITKTNSVEALLAINDGLQVDLLVTDQVMPHLTGLQLAREVHTRCPQLPVLLITGFSEQIDARNFAELGLRGFLNKPFRPRELALTIRRILDRSSED